MKNFEVCIRGVIKEKNKILVCYHKRENFYFFPGGHVRFGESVREAVLREFKEELGISVKKFFFIGAMENIYTFKGKIHHEFNF
ncbi:MAG: NUDIX domain-containing protein [Minisyncoccales bacterium]